MYKTQIIPRFNDTDALGHINNASYASWFEEARKPVFKIFIPDLDPKKWCLILARLELDYLAQGDYQEEVIIETSIEKIGNSSFKLAQNAIQNDVVICKSLATLVQFDYQTNKSLKIDEEKIQLLNSL